MTRREIIKLAGVAPAALAFGSTATAATPRRLRMGGTGTAFAIRRNQAREAKTEYDMLEHCNSLGMGGVEMRLPSLEPAGVKAFRDRLESYDMYLVADGPRLPEDKSGLADYEKSVKAHVEAGATATRNPQTGRRWQIYKTLEDFKTDFEKCKRAVELAEPIASKHGLKLGIENHKGQRLGEQVDWLKSLSSEYVGLCFDFGNNMSLCDDPMEYLDEIAPIVVNTHIKDMAFAEYPDGFLMSEVPLGQGVIDLKKVVDTLRAQHPTLPIGLEMITRDPLEIPVLTESYQATFDPEVSPLSGRDLAHMLMLVKQKGWKKPLPHISQLDPVGQLKAEDDNNLACVNYARDVLGL